MKRLFAVLVLFACVGAFAGSRGEAKPVAAAAGGAYEPTTVLVGFSKSATATTRAADHKIVGGVVVNRFDWLNIDVVRIPQGTTPPDAAAKYRGLSGVSFAQTNNIYTIDSIPNDPRFGDMWGLNNTGQTGGKPDADIDAPEGWTAAFGAGNFPSTGGIRVGMLDTGIDQNHVDLQGRTKACARATTGSGAITVGQCPDDNGHGTHTSGTVAALTNNGVGVAGVATNAELAIFKGFNSGGSGFDADLIAGLHWLSTTGQAKVINNSWGGPGSPGLQAEVQFDDANGVLNIAAAGNSGCNCISFPAGYPEVIGVPATDHNDLRASFSNMNSDNEIAGPGVSILSTTPNNTYSFFSGTSMATPHVVGVAALVEWKFGTDNHATRTILDNSVDDLGVAGRDTSFGFGRINLAKAMGGAPPPEPGAIAGRVKRNRASGGGPIAGATVNCGPGGSAVTGSDGRYTISNVPAGSYSCTASASGFNPKTKNVTVNSGLTSKLNFALAAL
jgi:thermitase